MGESSNTGNKKVLSNLLRFVIKLDVQDTRRSLSFLRGRHDNAVESDNNTLYVDQEIVSRGDRKTWWDAHRPNRRSLAAVDFYTLTDVVTDNFNGCFGDAFSRIEGTAPFDRVHLDYDEPNSGRYLRSLLLPSEAESRKLGEVVARFDGRAIFTKQEGLQVPNTNTVASVQLGCMQVVGTTLLADIQKAEYTSAGLGSNVIAVSASVSNNEPVDPGNTEVPPNQVKNDSNSDDGGLDVVIVVAIVIAILATTLLALALIIAWRRKKRAESAYMIGTKSSKVKSRKSRGRRGGSSLNPSDTPTTERSGGNISGKEPPLPGEEGEDDSELVVSQMSSGLYPESVISDDINSSLQAYEKSGGRQHPVQGAKREMDNQSVSSMESYGYSLDGYASSLAPSTQYGY